MMLVLSTLTVTLADDEAEQRFLEAFGKAVSVLDQVPGLERFTAAKVIGAERTYLVNSLWESAEAIDAWNANPMYVRMREGAPADLLAGYATQRWQPLGEARTWDAA